MELSAIKQRFIKAKAVRKLWRTIINQNFGKGQFSRDPELWKAVSVDLMDAMDAESMLRILEDLQDVTDITDAARTEVVDLIRVTKEYIQTEG